MHITRRCRRGLAVIAAAVLAGGLAAPGIADAAPVTGPSLAEALAALPVEAEVRDGYKRGAFRHWIDEDGDGCTTRQEVLVAEAVMAPSFSDSKCAITGGQWYSYYDDQYVSDAGKLDIDHLVPLAESWDSGARDWNAAKRQAYANDLGEEVPLIAVTAGSNRSKADQDPAQWLPPAQDARCRYVFEWVAVKTRWRLSIDEAEKDAIAAIAATCPEAVITIAEP